MVELMTLSSSDEIYLLIAEQLRFRNEGDQLQAQKDTLNLALTCRRLKDVAYEVLYRAAFIARRQRGDTVFGGSYLLRTLMRRPRLAKRIQTLAISITGVSNMVTHDSSCPVSQDEALENCLCDWFQIAGRVVEYLDKNNLLDDLDATNQQEWLKGIRLGEEPAILGALLALLPSLHSLTIHKRGVVEDDSPQNFRYEPGSIDPWKMFGLSDMEGEDFFARIPGLSNLRHLSANCLLPTCMIKLATLQTLKLGVRAIDSIDAWDPFNEDLHHDTYFATAIRELTLSTDNDLVTKVRRDYHSTSHELAYSIMQQARNLTNLIIKISPNNLTEYVMFGNYQTLIDNIPCTRIETLVIDNSGVSKSILRFKSPELQEIEKYYFRRTIHPGRTLSKFRSLRKLVVPQEVLFNTNAVFAPCELPADIEDISVVNTTTAVHQWAWHIFENMSKYPQLKSISLWTQNESKAHFGADTRLDLTYFDGEDEDYSDVEQVSVTDDDSDSKHKSGEGLEDIEVTDVVKEGDEKKEEVDLNDDWGNKKVPKFPKLPSPFSGRRSKAWAKLQKAGISVTLDYHRDQPWDRL
jgi:hypothetical protein